MAVIDLTRVPAPAVVEPLDYEAILAAMRADLQAKVPDLALAETDPATKVLEVAAYRELLLRARVNEAARAVMLPYALGADLDNLATLFGVQRLVITLADPNANPPTEAIMEDDGPLRERVQLSLDGLSVAGPERAYVFHARSASGQVLDASATSPSPGEVVVSVLARAGDGTADQALLDTVAAAVSAEGVRPLTDHVTVQAAAIVPYAVEATLYTYAGPDTSVVLANAQAAMEQLAQQTHKLGYDVTLSAIYAALQQPGVQRVELAAPTAGLVIDRDQAAYCTSITLTYGGIDE